MEIVPDNVIAIVVVWYTTATFNTSKTKHKTAGIHAAHTQPNSKSDRKRDAHIPDSGNTLTSTLLSYLGLPLQIHSKLCSIL